MDVRMRGEYCEGCQGLKGLIYQVWWNGKAI
jgi:hypothetical protein